MTVGKGEGREGDGEPQSLAGGTWVWDLGCLGLGHGVTEPASQLPILLVTLENIPERFQGVWGEEVDAAVDDVTDEGAGFLHVVQDLRQGRHSSQWRVDRHTTTSYYISPDPRYCQEELPKGVVHTLALPGFTSPGG